MTSEQVLSDFMAQQYSDVKLAELLAWVEDGGLAYHTCCCFVGLLTADHAYKRAGEFAEKYADDVPHFDRAMELPGAEEAEDAFDCLADTDEGRREKLMPLIHAEIARRDALRVAVCEGESIELMGAKV